MKVAYLEDTTQEAVAALVHSVLKGRGALVTEHTQSHVRFEGLNPGAEYSFSKGGYAGIYQHTGERNVQLRLRVEATVPSRMFWTTVATEFVATLLVYVWSMTAGLSSTLWVVFAAVAYAVLFGVLLVYVGTWRSSWALEGDLLVAFLDAARSSAEPPAGVLTQEERELRDFEASLEGDLERRRLAEARRALKATPAAVEPLPAAGSRMERFRSLIPSLRLRPKAPPRPREADAAEDAQAKRERLEALKKEIERRREREG